MLYCIHEQGKEEGDLKTLRNKSSLKTKNLWKRNGKTYSKEMRRM